MSGAKDPKDKEIQAELEAMRLPRGGIGFSLSRVQLVKILFTAGMLALVIVIQRPCSNAVSGFVTDFDNPGSNAQMPKPDTIDPGPKVDIRESIRPGMSDAEVKAAIDRAWARGGQAAPQPFSWFDLPAVFQAAATGSGSGSAAPGGATNMAP